MAGRAQARLACRVRQFNGCALQPGRGHLARQRALEDQLVQPGMIATRRPLTTKIGRANGFVRFLRILGLGLINAGLIGHIASIIAIRDGLARGTNGRSIHLHAIGPHIGNCAIFVQRLRQPHRVRRRKAKLTCGFLLQGRGGERRRRIARQRLGFNGLDGKTSRLHSGLGNLRIARIAKRQLFNLFALMAHQPCDKGNAVLLQRGGD